MTSFIRVGANKSARVPDEVVVMDSTVWISALHFGGIPRRALKFAAQQHRIVCSDYIRSEVDRTLTVKFGWNAAKVQTAMFESLGTTPDLLLPRKLKGVCRDPNDDLILECAIINKARTIVSGDRDLLVLDPYAGISILSPRQYLDRWAPAVF